MTTAPISLPLEALVVNFTGRDGTFYQPGQVVCWQAQQGKGCISIQMVVWGSRELGVVADGKILDAAVAVKTDTARTDTPYRKGDLQEVISSVDFHSANCFWHLGRFIRTATVCAINPKRLPNLCQAAAPLWRSVSKLFPRPESQVAIRNFLEGCAVYTRDENIGTPTFIYGS